MIDYSGPERRLSMVKELERLIVGQENIKESIDSLVERVSQQNGRVAKIEMKCVGLDIEAAAAKTGLEIASKQISNDSSRITDLEQFRWSLGGIGRATTSIFKDAMTAAALGALLWRTFHG